MSVAAIPLRVAGVTIPDSSIAREAMELARDVSSPMLFNHVMRSFIFGKLATADSVEKADDELTFLATTLHDLGLTSHATGPRRFEIEGADAARRFLGEHDYGDAAAWLVWDTIALHTWGDINLYKQPEARVAQMGITADVVGFGLASVERSAIEEVVRAFPRHQFNRDFFALLLKEAREKPDSHIVHPVHMVGHHCCGGVPIPDARAMIDASPFGE